MSHLTTIETKIRSLDSLKLAAERLGGELRLGQNHYQWYGRFVGDSPMPIGFVEAELGKCTHAISFPGAAYEVGVVPAKDGDGWTLLFDFWGSGGLEPIVGKGGTKLAQAYSVEATKAEVKKKGYSVWETRQKDGSIDLKISRN